MTKNFKYSEFKCKCGNCEMPKEVYENMQKVAEQLQVLRDFLGRGIKINSGYRCPEHNENIGGTKNSQHKLGKASDIVVSGMEPEVVKAQIEDRILNGEMLQGGLGLYNTFVHYDIRGEKARWNYVS
ncbi:MAG: putative peptidase M15 [Prokaryotic dsDNA virus sp.]|nr:MAG: putative peptidase M15 [Prokaryotic dsDNA virus sp.]|tara:strand:+ start:20869 stop:21249 length:381 start_codon:yes stop_codon:yes gene_type:complete